MKKIKLMALLAALGLTFSIGTSVNAEVGYLDYQKVLDNYPAAQQAVKDIDAKGLELQQYMLEKEKQYKTLDTPLKKQNFETQTANEFKAKQDALYKLRSDMFFVLTEFCHSKILGLANVSKEDKLSQQKWKCFSNTARQRFLP